MVGVMQCMRWYQVLTKWHRHLQNKTKKTEIHMWDLGFSQQWCWRFKPHKMWQCGTGQVVPVFQMITVPSSPGSSRPRTVTEWLHKQVLTTRAGASEDQKWKINTTQFYNYSTVYTAQWLLYVSSGLVFKNSTFCPHSASVSFVWISEQTAIISLHSTDWLVFITETKSKTVQYEPDV